MPRLTYGMPVATVTRLVKQARFFQRLLLILGTNTQAIARALKVSCKTTRDWRELNEPIPREFHNVLMAAYYDYMDYTLGPIGAPLPIPRVTHNPAEKWMIFAAALNRRARAARLPGFGDAYV
jgi:hypothetical protein